MLNSSTQTIETFTLAGRFSPSSLVASGILLLSIIGLLSWWELHRTKPRLIPLFVLLRALAVAVVLWMLAEPSIETTVKRTHAKTIAVMADASASMATVDPVREQAEAVRWALSQETSSQAEMLTLLDGAVLEMRLVCALFSRSVDAAGKNGPIKPARECIAQARVRAASVGKLLDACADHAESGRDVIKQELEAVRAKWKDVALPSVTETADDMDQGRWQPSQGQGGHVQQSGQSLHGLTERTNALAEAYAAAIDRQGDAASQELIASRARRTRRDKAADLLNRIEPAALRRIEGKAEVLRYGFDSEVFPVERWADVRSPSRGAADQQTDLAAPFARIEQDSTGRSLAAVVLVTDGAHNARNDPLKKAAALAQIPVYVVPVGNTKPVRDVMIHHAQAPRNVFQNNLVVIEAMLDAQECAGEQLSVELLQNERVVDQQRVAVVGDSFFTPLTFKRKAETLGTVEYRIRVAPVAEERTTEDNEAKVQVEVIEGTIRVFLADQLPRWEFRYLRNLLKRDSRIQFESLQFDPISANGPAGAAVRLPDNTDAWDRYRVVILGDVSPTVLTANHQQQLKDYVSLRGGTLVLIAGETAMPSSYANGPLGSILPVESVPGRLAEGEILHLMVTPEGRTTDVTQLAENASLSDRMWSELLGVQKLSAYSVAKPTSHVWVSAAPISSARPASSPLTAFMCWQKYGKGRIMYLSAPVTYRLRYRYGDRYHHQFWGQLLRWAIARDMGSGSNTVRLITDKTHYQTGEDVPVTVRLSHVNGQAAAKAVVSIVAKSQEQTRAGVTATEDRDSPGVYRAMLKDLPVGNVTIGVEGPEIRALLAEEQFSQVVETRVVIEPPLSFELRNTRCNLPLLTQMATVTGGAVVTPTAVQTLLAGIDLDPRVTEEVCRDALWPRWTYLAVFLASLSIEWITRKLVGLA